MDVATASAGCTSAAKGYSASENQIIPPLSSLAPEPSPTVFSPPSRSSLSQRQTGRASLHSLVRDSSNRPGLLQRLVLRLIAAVPCLIRRIAQGFCSGSYSV